MEGIVLRYLMRNGAVLSGTLLILFVSAPASGASKFKEKFVMEKVEVSTNIGFVHYFSDIFRANEMGRQLGVGIGIKPKIRILEFVSRFDYTFIRMAETNDYYDRFNGKFVGITTLELALCLPVDVSNRSSVEIGTSMGAVLFSIEDYKTRPGFAGAFMGRFYLRPRPDRRFKIGIFFEAHSYIWTIEPQKDKWKKEFFVPEKEHIQRDVNLLLGVIAAFGGDLPKAAVEVR